MSQRNIVVIGASAGGIAALQTIVRQLPEHFPAAIFIVLHLSRDSSGLLPDILSRTGPLPASNARNGDQQT